MAGEEGSKGIHLGSPGWTCSHEGTRRSASPSGVCRDGKGTHRCVNTGVRVPMVACRFAVCGACGVLREEEHLLGAAKNWLRQEVSQRVASSPAPEDSG